jgi:hypothetical protein
MSEMKCNSTISEGSEAGICDNRCSWLKGVRVATEEDLNETALPTPKIGP